MKKKKDYLYSRDINKDFINKEINIRGFIANIKKLGKIWFIELRDFYGSIQLIINANNIDVPIIKNEYLVDVTGEVKIKQGSSNKEFEVLVKELEIISKSELTPFIIANKTDGLEPIRLKYRYLDLRREEQKKLLINRYKIIKIIRDFYDKNEFIEVETPILTKSTPEGANEFLVPTNCFDANNKLINNEFFSLAQSPQIYKQFLMISGFDKYYQIARCFRNEELRSDRQLEFTQLDVEQSFVNENDVIKNTEEMFKYLFKKFMNLDLKIPFNRINYDDAINMYGSDSPDLRFNLKIENLSPLFSNNKRVYVIFIDNELTTKEFVELDRIAKKSGGKGINYYSKKSNDIEKVSINSYPEFFNKKNLEILNNHKKHISFIGLIEENITEEKRIKNLNILGKVRYELGQILNLTDNNDYNFLWVVDWPLFTKEDNQYKSMHHPFTSPKDEYKSLVNATSKAYDIVLNGKEIGGGSIRINDAKLQEEVFKILGLSNDDIKEKFSHFIDAFSYSVPPHGGIALGIDRIISLMLHADSIRDVIAFPKNSTGRSDLENVPNKLHKFS